MPEMKVNTPDGFKKYRFADVAEVDPKTNKVKKYHQVGKKTKKGNPVALESIDLCEMAIQGGAGFVARGFSGDRKQVVEMLKAAFSHTGLSFLDIISPCVSFNNVPTSTKSY